MKKTFLSFAVLAATLFASCSKDAEIATPAQPLNATGETIVAVTLSDDATTTRAASAAATSWEKSLSSLTIFAFDDGEDLILKRAFTASELSSKAATFALPKSVADTDCEFYAVANIDVASVVNRAALLALMETNAGVYNGTYADVTTKANRAGGFVMSGVANKRIGAVNTTTSVPITIKRTVAKVGLNVALDPTFAEQYPGSTLTFTSAKVSKAASQSRVVAGAVNSGAMSFTHTQTLSSNKAMFYLFENGAPSERVLMEITAMFDRDGNTSTTDDRSEVVYPIMLSGSGNGDILRNNYYEITATVRGLVGQDCNVAVSVADWETPISQSVNLGM